MYFVGIKILQYLHQYVARFEMAVPLEKHALTRQRAAGDLVQSGEAADAAGGDGAPAEEKRVDALLLGTVAAGRRRRADGADAIELRPRTDGPY